MLNAARLDFMYPVSAWINHLYCCELLYLNRPAVAAGPSMEADAWMTHSYRNVIDQSIVTVQAPAAGLKKWGLRITLAALRTELLTSNIQIGNRYNKEALLLSANSWHTMPAFLTDNNDTVGWVWVACWQTL